MTDRWRNLRKKAIEGAELHPQYDDWIILHGFNPTGGIDDFIQDEAADVMANVFRGTNPDIILGIGNSGLPFTQKVKRRFPNSDYLEVEKLESAANGRYIDGE
ncbi:hypothetical protein HYW87_00060, partial [Candidatus Roizmanbacteria bacterium]|nr:hypothetical protein [Candidatus Roizmanbacteria bacterium]